MAKSGNTTINVTSDGYIKLRYSWSAGTPNIANNFTPVNWTLQLISSNSSANINSSAAKDYSVTTDGTPKTGTNTIGLSGGSTKTLASGSKNIYHSADGTKSFSYSFSQDFGITYSGAAVGTKTGNGTGTLDSIYRSSVLGTISAFTIGNAITIPITKYSSSFYDVLTISVGGTVVKTVNGITNNASITFTTTELNNIYAKLPSATSGTFTFKLTTKTSSSGSVVGTSSKTVKGTISSTIKPGISNFSLVENNSAISTKFALLIQNKTQLKGTITASAGTGSSIDEYKTTINGATYTSSSFVTGVLKTSGSNSYSVTVTDKRGRTASFSGTFNVTAYSSPTISNFKVVRSDASGNEDDEGAYAKVTCSATINALSNKNDKTFKLEYKKRSATTWTTAETYTAGYTYTLTNKIISGISTEDTYDFRLTATDYFGSAIKTLSLSTAFTILDIKADGTGIAFGKVATKSGVFDNGFKETYLSNDTYLGGQDNDDSEKNLFFTNTGTGLNKHKVKLYGGNGNSITAMGMWDVIKDLPIFQYFDGDEYRLKFGDDINLKWGAYDVESVLAKVFSGATGRYRTRTGLLLQWGSVTITPVANTPTSAAITFPIAYDEVPNIQVSAVSGVPYTNVLGYAHASDSATGTTLWVTRTNTTATVLRWFAIGIKEM